VRHRHCCYTEGVWSTAAAAASKASFACSRAIGLEYDAAAEPTSTAAIKRLNSSSSSGTTSLRSSVAAGLRTSAVAAGLRGKLAKVRTVGIYVRRGLQLNMTVSHLP
jgi:hypothetical protein